VLNFEKLYRTDKRWEANGSKILVKSCTDFLLKVFKLYSGYFLLKLYENYWWFHIFRQSSFWGSPRSPWKSPPSSQSISWRLWGNVCEYFNIFLGVLHWEWSKVFNRTNFYRHKTISHESKTSEDNLKRYPLSFGWKKNRAEGPRIVLAVQKPANCACDP